MSSCTRASILIFNLIVTGISYDTTPHSHGDMPVQTCDKERFGPMCQFKCYCLHLQCNSTNGECIEGHSCISGMFGLACQYEDLLYKHVKDTSNPILFDQKDETCNKKQPLDPLEAFFTLLEVFPLYWIRLRVNTFFDDSHVNLKEFSVEINDKVDCNVKLYRVDDFTYDMFCSGIHFVTKVLLKGELVTNLCTVQFSGGRNIAVNGFPTQSSTNPGFRPENAIDSDWGGMHHPEEECASTANGDTDLSPVWNVTFAYPTVVFRMVIIFNSGTPQQNLTIIQWDVNGKAIHLFNISTEHPVEAMLAKNLSFTKTVSVYGWSPPLYFCELEISGDSYCEAPNSWGLMCEYKCSCGSNGTYCFPNHGFCVQGCNHGHYGMGCTSVCPSQCPDNACHFHTGGCLTCPPGFKGALCNMPCDSYHFGASCQQMCSKNCLGGKCDSFLGNCTCTGVFTGPNCNECPISFFGPQCKQKCSTFCVKQECNLNTGKCFQCPKGFSGFNCSVCPPSKFGENCTGDCPETCYLKKCHDSNGTCHSCAAGFTGDYCESKLEGSDKGQSGLYMLGVGFGTAALATILFSIFLCKKMHLKKDTKQREELN